MKEKKDIPKRKIPCYSTLKSRHVWPPCWSASVFPSTWRPILGFNLRDEKAILLYKTMENIAQVLHNIIESYFFCYFCVHQYGHRDVTRKPRINGPRHAKRDWTTLHVTSSNLHLKTCAKNGGRNKFLARCSSNGDKFISNGLQIPIKAARCSIWKLGHLSPFIEAVFHR